MKTGLECITDQIFSMLAGADSYSDDGDDYYNYTDDYHNYTDDGMALDLKVSVTSSSS